MKKSTLALSLATTAMLAFGIGRFTAPAPERQTPSPTRQAARSERLAQESQRERLEPSTVAATPQTVSLQSIDSIVSSGSVIDAIPLFDKHLELLTSENAFDKLSQLQELPSSRLKSILLNRLFKKWGEVDGATAFATAQALEGRERLRFLGEAAAGWSNTDIVSAWDALMIASNDGALHQLPLGPTLREVAKQDLELAMTLMAEAGNSPASANRFKAILHVAAEKGEYRQLLDSLMLNGELSNKPRYVRSLFEEWGKHDLNTPLQAIAALNDDSLSNPAMSGIMSGWSRIDAHGAFSHALAHSDDPLMARSLPELAKQLARSSTADEMIGAFDQIENPEHQSRIAKAIMGDLANADPYAAMNWANQLTDQKVKANSVSQILGTYARNDYSGAKELYRTIDDPKMQLQALTGIAYSQVRQNRSLNVTDTVELIDAIKDQDAREKALERLGGIANSLKKRDNLHFTDEYIAMIEERDDLSRVKKDKLIKPLLPKRSKKKN